jgi:PIN domain nuclease of toxin-antitoxin system
LSDYVVDTHVLYWHLSKSENLSDAVREIMAGADNGANQIYVPGIILVELVYLAERSRVEQPLVDQAFRLLRDAASQYRLAELSYDTVEAMRQVPRDAVPDMPDRIIVATAKQLGLPLISRDGKIRRSGAVPIVW